MKDSDMFRPIDQNRLMEINGGGFAYDVGRVLRFLVLSTDSILGVSAGVMDWQLNKEISDIVNR